MPKLSSGGTDAAGHEYFMISRDPTTALNKLASLANLSSKREWEKAAYIALFIRRGKSGRPVANTPNVRGITGHYSITEFCRKGIFGFRSPDTIRAYLKAWEISGLPIPEYGERIDYPIEEFPDTPTLYGRLSKKDDEEPPEDEPEPEPEPEDELDDEEDDDPEPPEDEEKPERRKRRPKPGPKPAPKPKPEPEPEPDTLTLMDELMGDCDVDAVVAHWADMPDRAREILDEIAAWATAMRAENFADAPAPAKRTRPRSRKLHVA